MKTFYKVDRSLDDRFTLQKAKLEKLYGDMHYEGWRDSIKKAYYVALKEIRDSIKSQREDLFKEDESLKALQKFKEKLEG